MTDKFCLHCTPNKHGKHEKKCPLFQRQKEKDTKILTEEFDDLLEDLAEVLKDGPP